MEATTYRWHGHYEGDPERYRTSDEKEEWAARDPLVIAAPASTTPESATTCSLPSARRSARDLDAAVVAARRLAQPTVATLGDFVVHARPERTEPSAPPSDAPVFRVMDAVHDALEAELASDDRVFVAGIDVAAGGNVFGLTRGLHDEFGERVRDTPISESAIVGLGVGAAMAGMRPVVELMYLDFLGVCLDQLLNQAAKLPFMTGGAAQMALTVRTQLSAGRSSGSQHSQSLEVLLTHIPGLTVVMPSTPADTYGLLPRRHPGSQPGGVHREPSAVRDEGSTTAADHVLPIGRAAIVRPGSDLTLVSVSRMVHDALAAAELVATEGISVGDRSAHGRAPRHHHHPRVGGAHESLAHRARSGRAVRHRAGRRSRRRSRTKGSGTSTHRSSASGPRPRLPRTTPTSNTAWLPDAHTIADHDPPGGFCVSSALS